MRFFGITGLTVLTGFENGMIILWDVATGREIRRFVGHTNIVGNLLFSRDGRTAVSGSWDNTVILWDVATGAIIHHMADHSASVYRIALSPDDHFVFAGSGDNTSTLWDLRTGQVVRRFVGQAAGPAAIFSPDGRTLFIGLQDGSVQWWRVDSLDEMFTWINANRYIPELDCKQQLLYRLMPACDANGAFPTSTTYPDMPSAATGAPS